jgi:hypothetical protein
LHKELIKARVRRVLVSGNRYSPDTGGIGYCSLSTAVGISAPDTDTCYWL